MPRALIVCACYLSADCVPLLFERLPRELPNSTEITRYPTDGTANGKHQAGYVGEQAACGGKKHRSAVFKRIFDLSDPRRSADTQLGSLHGRFSHHACCRLKKSRSLRAESSPGT